MFEMLLDAPWLDNETYIKHLYKYKFKYVYIYIYIYVSMKHESIYKSNTKGLRQPIYILSLTTSFDGGVD